MEAQSLNPRPPGKSQKLIFVQKRLTVLAGSFHGQVGLPEFTQDRGIPGGRLTSLWFRVWWAPATRMLRVPERLSDPRSLPFSTVNSKAEVRFHLASADWIAEPVRQKMALMVNHRPLLSL